MAAIQSTMTTPKILNDDLSAKISWLDLECPTCQTRNRIGVRCPREGKPCRNCNTVLDFWSAWQQWDRDIEDRYLMREYWADQL